MCTYLKTNIDPSESFNHLLLNLQNCLLVCVCYNISGHIVYLARQTYNLVTDAVLKAALSKLFMIFFPRRFLIQSVLNYPLL